MNELEKLRQLTEVLTSNGYLTDQTRAWEYAFDSVDSLVLITNPNYKIKFINKALSRLLHSTTSEFINTEVSSMLGGNLINKDEVEAEVSYGKSIILGTFFIEPLSIWVHKKKYSISDDYGNIIGFMFILEDVTQAELASKKVNEAYNQMLAMFDSMDEPVYVSDPITHEVLFINKVGREAFGGDVVGQKCYEALQGKNSPCHFCTNNRIFSSESKDKTFTWVTKNKINGEWYKCIDRSIKWHDGRRVRFELAVNITEQKLNEQRIVEALKRMHFMIKAADGYLWEKEIRDEGEMVYTYADPTFCKEILGFSSPVVEKKEATLVELNRPSCSIVTIKKDDADDSCCSMIEQEKEDNSIEEYSCSIAVGRTTSDIIDEFISSGRKHSFKSVSAVSDAHTISIGKPCEYLEMGYIEHEKGNPEWVTIRVRKTPIFNYDGECTGIIGFASKCSEYTHAIRTLIEKGLITGCIKKLHTNEVESKLYWVIDATDKVEESKLTHLDFP